MTRRSESEENENIASIKRFSVSELENSLKIDVISNKKIILASTINISASVPPTLMNDSILKQTNTEFETANIFYQAEKDNYKKMEQGRGNKIGCCEKVKQLFKIPIDKIIWMCRSLIKKIKSFF